MRSAQRSVSDKITSVRKQMTAEDGEMLGEGEAPDRRSIERTESNEPWSVCNAEHRLNGGE